MRNVQPIVAKAAGDWQFEVRGLAMGVDTPYMVSEVTGLLNRAPRASYAHRPLRHGSLPAPDFVGQKQVIISLTLPNPDYSGVLGAPARNFTSNFVPTGAPPRSDISLWLGYKFKTTNNPPTIGALGRWVLDNNVNSHMVQIVREGDNVLVAEALVRTLGVQVGTFAQGLLERPVKLHPDTSYYLVSAEVTSGDGWLEIGSTFDLDPVHFVPGTTGAYRLLTGGDFIETVVPGGYVLPTMYGVDDLPLDILIDELQEAWTPVLDGSTVLPLSYQLPNQPRRRLYGRPRNFSVDMEHYEDGWVDAVLEFIATDPVIYSDAPHDIAIPLGQVGVGRSYPRVYPMAYGESTSSMATLINEGNTGADPVVNFSGPITNPSVENVTTGQKVSFAISLGEGETLEVNFSEKTVILNGSASRYNTLISTNDQWFQLQPGANAVRYGASNFVPGSVMSVQWRSAWL